MSDQRRVSQRAICSALLAGSTLFLCSCSGSGTVSTQSSSPNSETSLVAPAPPTNSLSTAYAEAKRLAADTAAAVFPGQKGEQSGPAERSCDPPEAGLVNSDYTIKFPVSSDEVDSKAIAGWNHLEQLGFVLDGGTEPKAGGPNGPAPRGKLGEYRGAITGNRDDAVVYIEVVTPCLYPGS